LPSAVPTRFGAHLTVVGIVLFALRGAGFTDFGAERAQLCRKRTPCRHKLRSQPTNRCAITIDQDAFSHHLEVGLVEAGGGAVITRRSALVTGVDAVFELPMCHDCPFVPSRPAMLHDSFHDASDAQQPIRSVAREAFDPLQNAPVFFRIVTLLAHARCVNRGGRRATCSITVSIVIHALHVRLGWLCS
jgi:hypothetical protein